MAKITRELLLKAKEGDAVAVKTIVREISFNGDGTNKIDCVWKRYRSVVERDDVQFYFDYHLSKTINAVWWNREGRKPELFGNFIWNLVMKAIIDDINKKTAKKIPEQYRVNYKAIKNGTGSIIDINEAGDRIEFITEGKIERNIDARKRYEYIKDSIECSRLEKVLFLVCKGFKVREIAEICNKSAQTIRNDIKNLLQISAEIV